MHNMTICICSDSKAALLALSSYTILSKLLHQCWLSLQDHSIIKTGGIVLGARSLRH
jgi:hypothetical protein